MAGGGGRERNFKGAVVNVRWTRIELKIYLSHTAEHTYPQRRRRRQPDKTRSGCPVNLRYTEKEISWTKREKIFLGADQLLTFLRNGFFIFVVVVKWAEKFPSGKQSRLRNLVKLRTRVSFLGCVLEKSNWRALTNFVTSLRPSQSNSIQITRPI